MVGVEGLIQLGFRLKYGKTDGSNLPHMPKDKYFDIGYNPRFGLVDVMEGNGEPFFEGRVNIEKLLSNIRTVSQLDTDKQIEDVDTQVEEFIMKSYENWWRNQENPEKHVSAPTPILEVLTYNG